MKTKVVWVVFIMAILFLLLSQVVWLLSAFREKQSDIQEKLNATFTKAVEKELSDRFVYSSVLIDANPEKYNNRTFTFEFDNQAVKEDGLLSSETRNHQEILAYLDMPLKLSTLDSIYSSMLQAKGLSTQYKINNQDSIRVIESIGVNLSHGFKTDMIPIVNGTEVQAIVSVTMPFILKEMLGLLIASLLMLLLIIGCLIYELRVIFTQRRLAQLREDFSHALIHDMKSPLNTIYAAVDQWKKGALDKNPEMRTQFGETAITQVLNLQALVDKILTIARLEKNNLTLDERLFNLPKMCQELVDKFSVQSKKKVQFNLHLNLEEEQILADPTYLLNAVSNLIDNAIKYSNDPVVIDISCRMNNNKLYIKVRDNGFGISKSDQLKIFEKFERGAAIGRKGAKGFGLGLNYVKRVAEAHGGTVAVSSIEGQGSEFVLFIPLTVKTLEPEDLI